MPLTVYSPHAAITDVPLFPPCLPVKSVTRACRHCTARSLLSAFSPAAGPGASSHTLRQHSQYYILPPGHGFPDQGRPLSLCLWVEMHVDVGRCSRVEVMKHWGLRGRVKDEAADS
eukprot:1159266-Pelagomonas_calceolata.AAC.2